MRRIARVGVAIAAWAGLALGNVACGDDGEESVDLGGDATTTTEGDEVDEEAEILDAYYAGWEAFSEASNPADPAHPALQETMTGDALEAVQNTLTPMAEVGEYFDGPPVEHSATVSDISPEQAIVDDCTISSADHFAADGSTIEEATGTPVLSDAVMVNEDGTWKRSELNIRDEPCEP